MINCPRCDRTVQVVQDKIVPHEHSTCTGSQMVWGTCPMSGKKCQTIWHVIELMSRVLGRIKPEPNEKELLKERREVLAAYDALRSL